MYYVKSHKEKESMVCTFSYLVLHHTHCVYDMYTFCTHHEFKKKRESAAECSIHFFFKTSFLHKKTNKNVLFLQSMFPLSHYFHSFTYPYSYRMTGRNVMEWSAWYEIQLDFFEIFFLHNERNEKTASKYCFGMKCMHSSCNSCIKEKVERKGVCTCTLKMTIFSFGEFRTRATACWKWWNKEERKASVVMSASWIVTLLKSSSSVT